MSRIGDALKRAGALDLTGEVIDLPLAGDDVPDPGSTREPVTLPRLDGEPPPDPQARARVSHREPPTFATAGALDSHLIVNPELPPLAVEQYRRLAATLHHVQEDRGVRRVIVSSAVANEGKTLTSTNLALTLSHSYARRVLLIDADLRRPRVHVMFGLPNGIGVSEMLASVEPQKAPVVQLSPYLSVLPAGRATSDPMAALTSSRMAAILDEAVERFDWVIIDTPPVGMLSDARLVAAMADVALLVVGAGTTPCAAVQHSIEALGRERVLGVVLNRADEALAGGSYYYYHGYYGDSKHKNRSVFSRLLGRP
jgi:capsular exopolysaccharide synthesis family protein